MSEDADTNSNTWTNTDITKGFIVRQSPAGKPEFAVQFDVKNFSPEEVKVSTKDGKLEITGESDRMRRPDDNIENALQLLFNRLVWTSWPDLYISQFC